MKTRRFDFNFRPLQINRSIDVDGSVPDRQTYDAETGTYTPDYTLTNLVLQAHVSRFDKDEILAAGSINHLLANVRWYEIIDGVRTLIEAGNSSYELVSTGGQAGRIRVKKNVEPQHPLTLEFYAEYVDSRTSQIHTIRETHLVMCANESIFPVLTLDCSDQTVYDPLVDVADQVVAASLRYGTSDIASANRIFVWEILRESGIYSEVGDEPALDYCVTVANDGNSVIVHRDLMGEELSLRCRAKYSSAGTPGSVTLDDYAPSKVVVFRRRVHKFDFDIVDCPVNIPAGSVAIAPRAIIFDTNGEIANPERALFVHWLVATNVSSGSLSYRKIAHGRNPGMIPTSDMDPSLGAVFGIDVVDIGPLCALEDSDGVLIEDYDGCILLIN